MLARQAFEPTEQSYQPLLFKCWISFGLYMIMVSPLLYLLAPGIWFWDLSEALVEILVRKCLIYQYSFTAIEGSNQTGQARRPHLFTWLTSLAPQVMSLLLPCLPAEWSLLLVALKSTLDSIIPQFKILQRASQSTKKAFQRPYVLPPQTYCMVSCLLFFTSSQVIPPD